MNNNPYSSPAGHDDRLLRLTVQRLIAFRTKPPTLIGLLLSWRSLPLLALLGVLTLIWGEVISLPREFTLPMEGVIIGAALRDLGIARRQIRLWGIQKDLLDWPKIEAISRELEI